MTWPSQPHIATRSRGLLGKGTTICPVVEGKSRCHWYGGIKAGSSAEAVVRVTSGAWGGDGRKMIINLYKYILFPLVAVGCVVRCAPFPESFIFLTVHLLYEPEPRCELRPLQLFWYFRAWLSTFKSRLTMAGDDDAKRTPLSLRRDKPLLSCSSCRRRK